MKKLVLLFLLFTMARFGFGQIYFTFDSIANPPYICQAHTFDVEFFGMLSSGIPRYTSSSVVVSNDSIYVNLFYITGPGGTAAPYPLYRKVTVPGPVAFGRYKIIARGFYDGQLHRSLTSAISICSAISGISKTDKTELQLSVFPNPVHDLLQVAVPVNKAGLKFTLTNVIGTTLQTKVLPAGTLQARLNLKALPAGMYLLQVASDEKKITQKIIKR